MFWVLFEYFKISYFPLFEHLCKLSISIGSCFLDQLLNLCTSISQLRYFFVVTMDRICLAILQLGHFKLFFFENIFKLFILHINSSCYNIFLLLKGVILFIQCFGLSKSFLMSIQVDAILVGNLLQLDHFNFQIIN